MTNRESTALEDGLDIRGVLTTGSILHISQDYHEPEYQIEAQQIKTDIDLLGEPIKCFSELRSQFTPVDATGLVLKKIIGEGGGLPLHDGCTVDIAFSGYWENNSEPFDVRTPNKPLIVVLNDSGLLPGLLIAVQSMLVGEFSVFLLPYQLMYGELGIPPRIKPKADCIFYIKLIKMILTPTEGKVDFSQTNMFMKVFREVKLLYASGATLYKCKNITMAISLFRKAVYMLHHVRLADEKEEIEQEQMLIKLYTNLAVCNNIIKQPLRVCIACNELHRLRALWSSGKALFLNAKALRMIGQFDEAERKLKRAQGLCPNKTEIQAELELLRNSRISCDQSKLIVEKLTGFKPVSEEFKLQVDDLIKNFKENDNLCKLTLPDGLNTHETKYIKEACIRENLFLSKIHQHNALDKEMASDEEYLL